MEDLMKGLDPNKVSIVRINDDLKKYQNDKRILAKVARMNAILAEGGLPDCIYEMQEKIEAEKSYEALLVDKELSVACEPAPEYNSSKPMDKA